MSEWVSSRDALRLANEKGVDREDLIEWARLGDLRARAVSGVFSSDDPPEVRLFPETPYADETKRLVLGPWPDIPTDFWAQAPKKATWNAGTFASALTYWDDYYDEEKFDFIELRDVSFNRRELEALLLGVNKHSNMPEMPRKRWQHKRSTRQQFIAMKFMDVITATPPNELGGKTDRYEKYCKWHSKQATPQDGKPLGRTTFNVYADRHEDGWRLLGGKWVHKP